jgi:hypothetical protein
MTVLKALSAVQQDLAAIGIAKNQTNEYDKYKFRGIDDVLNAMAPILAKHGVMIIPSIGEVITNQVPTAKGGIQFHTTIRIDYTLYNSEGDHIKHSAIGEAMDRGDKSINKAMSAAYKYFLFQCFCIPLQGQDADGESHEIAPVTYTDGQLDEFNTILDRQDALGFAVFSRKVGPDVMSALNRTFPDGRVSQGKKLCKDLEVAGWEKLRAYAAEIATATDTGDEGYLSQMADELNVDEKRVLAGILRPQDITALKNARVAA